MSAGHISFLSPLQHDVKQQQRYQKNDTTVFRSPEKNSVNIVADWIQKKKERH